MYVEGHAEPLNDGVDRRRTRVAIALSFLLHLLAALLVVRSVPQSRAERATAAPLEIVTITHAVRHRRPLPVRAPVRTALAPAPAAVPRATLPPRAPHAAQPSRAPRTVHAPSRPVVAPHVALAPHRAPIAVHAPAASGALSGTRIAQIESDLGKAIADDRGNIDPLRVPPGAAPDTKRYGTDYASFETGERRHHGLCDPVRDWQAGGWNYYYVACNVRFSDGSVERQGVPWPVRFAPSDDPFAGTAHDDRPLAMPLPGWHLEPGQTVSVELRAYAKQHGVDL